MCVFVCALCAYGYAGMYGASMPSACVVGMVGVWRVLQLCSCGCALGVYECVCVCVYMCVECDQGGCVGFVCVSVCVHV